MTIMFLVFSISQRMVYMTFGIGLMIGPGNCYSDGQAKLVYLFYQRLLFYACKVFYLFDWYKVSSWACDWWNCLSWIDIDSRHPVVVRI